MLSPRVIRPHNVIFKLNKGENDDGILVEENFEVKYCRVNENYNPNVAKDSRFSGVTIVITVDLSDAPKQVTELKYNDHVVYCGIEYIVNGIKKISLPLKNEVAFMEFTCVLI